ncbi:MAG: lipid-A-disaccharide synthase [Sedimentisphaerales bacterium]|nr:lipid-A-disaccharide synthase [Sedimentisphaerales bacterium]
MVEPEGKKRIFLSACEASGDAHCANLIKAIKETVSAMSSKSSAKGAGNQPLEIEFVGVGGKKMASAGCDLIEDTVQRAAMIYNVFGHIGYYYKLIKRIKNYFKENHVDLVVVCDSPAFHFHIAKAARKANVKVLWYVAPQLWAWAAWRVRKLKRRITKLACILPFEKDWFGSYKIDTTFVGNPIFDDLSIDINNSCKSYAEFDPRTAKIALFPGSRKAEIKSLWRPMQKIVTRLRQRWPNLEVTASAVDDTVLEELKKSTMKGFKCTYTTEPVDITSAKADLALVASGSATLQVAAAGCPMVIMYQSSKLLWHLFGQWLIKTRFLSLVNILARKELVKEFMPYFTSLEPIFGKCSALLNNKHRLIRLSRDLVTLVEPLATGKASQKTAQLALGMFTATANGDQ